MGELVAQLNAPAHGPLVEVATLWQVGVLRTGSGNEAHPAGEGVAPAQIDDMVNNLAAGILRELKQLKSVDCADLITTGKETTVSALNRSLVAVEQSMAGVVEMSVAESARHGDGGERIESLDRIEKRAIR